jgi:hypothetical protein
VLHTTPNIGPDRSKADMPSRPERIDRTRMTRFGNRPPARRGRWPPVRSRPAGAAYRRAHESGCGRSGRTTPSLGARAGAAESGWTIGRNRGSRLAGAPATMTGIAHTRRSWLDLRRMSCWSMARGLSAPAASDSLRADCVHVCHLPSRRRLYRQPGATRRQRHRLYAIRAEIAGAAQGDRA